MRNIEKVVEYIEDVRESGARTAKSDISVVKADITAVKMDLANVKADLEVKIAQSKAELIKWMFIFWITQTLSILGLLAYFLK